VATVSAVSQETLKSVRCGKYSMRNSPRNSSSTPFRKFVPFLDVGSVFSRGDDEPRITLRPIYQHETPLLYEDGK
jgi:hypothetical protein